MIDTEDLLWGSGVLQLQGKAVISNLEVIQFSRNRISCLCDPCQISVQMIELEVSPLELSWYF